MSDKVLLVPCFTAFLVLNARSVDPDQTPRSAASDLGPHFLPMSFLWDARGKWVKSSGPIELLTHSCEKRVTLKTLLRVVGMTDIAMCHYSSWADAINSNVLFFCLFVSCCIFNRSSMQIILEIRNYGFICNDWMSDTDDMVAFVCLATE